MFTISFQPLSGAFLISALPTMKAAYYDYYRHQVCLFWGEGDLFRCFCFFTKELYNPSNEKTD